MSWTFKMLGSSLFALSVATLHADEMLMPIEINVSESAAQASNEALATPATESPAAVQKPKAVVKRQEAFRPFTGKVKGKKVRMRTSPDMESHIVKELQKGDLLSIVEEKGDFWGVEPNADAKAYVFRSFVLDNVVEGNRVNVRLEPNLESPVIGHLNAGDKVEGSISSLNNKWLEIAPPKNARFYVAKDFIENVGGLEVKENQDKRHRAVTQMMEAASVVAKAEMKKSFNQIDFEKVARNYKALIEDYKDFPETVEMAQTEFAAVQEEYLQKRLAYLEEKATALAEEEQAEIAQAPKILDMTERMKMWQPIEEALYLTWANDNNDKSMQQYYEEQKLAAVPLTGVVDFYQTTAKSAPGDFVLKESNLPKAALYSTQVDLQKYVGKKVTLHAVQRPNNNFAFPAYFIVAVE